MVISQLFVALIAATIVGLCHGQACSSPDLADWQIDFLVSNPDPIRLGHTGLIAQFDMVNTISVRSLTNSPYIEAVYDAEERKLQYYPTKDLVDYDRTQTATSIQEEVELGCTTNTRKLTFEVQLSKENNHAPTFLQEVYEIVVTLPLPRSFDLTFFQEVSARDLDIWNNQVHFTSDDAVGVTVGTSQKLGSDGKTFYATLITSQQMLRVGEQLEFTIVATDSGTPPRNSRARVILRADADDIFIPVPNFASPFYRGRLNEDRALILETLAITEDTYHKDIVLELSGADSELFAIQRVDNIITMRLARALTDADIRNKNVLLTTVSAKRDDVEPGSTVVLVDVTQPDVTVPEVLPEFERLLYVGELNEDRELILDAVVLKTDTFGEDVVFSLVEGDYSLFTMERSANIVTVKLARSLNDEDAAGKTFLTTVLSANRPNVGIGATSIVVRISGSSEVVDPNLVPTFERTFYLGDISRDDGSLSYAVSPSLTENTYHDDVQFELTGDDADLFTVSNQQRIVSVGLRRQLTEAEKLKSLLLVTIVAKSAVGRTGSTEIIVTQEQAQAAIDQPVFEQRVYVGTIGVDGQLATFPAITLTVESITDGVKYELVDDDSLLLKMTTVDNVATLSLSRPLNDDELRQKTHLKALLIATNVQGITGTALIIVEITTPAAIPLPQFVQDVYRGSLDSNLALTFEPVSIVADTFAADVKLELLSDDYALFTVTKTSDDIISIDLVAPLTEADVADRTYLTTVLHATRPNVGETAVVLLVKLDITTPRPTIPTPRFSQPIFRGSIDDYLQLRTIDAVTLVESSYTTGVQFRLIGDDSALFTFTATAHSLQIVLVPGLTADNLLGKDFLSFRVEASHPETDTASAGVLIDIPAKVCALDETPIFENLVYTMALSTTAKGLLGQIRARVPGNEQRAMRYAFGTIDDGLVGRLALDATTGELSLIDNLGVGQYKAQVTAQDASTALTGSAEVRLTVSDVDTCPPEATLHHVDNSLLVKNLIENKEHLDIMPSTIGSECSFVVKKSNPDDVMYVRIDAATKMLTSVQFDREADIFASMAVPQIQVTLELICDDDITELTVNIDQRQFAEYSNETVRSSDASRSLDPMASDGRWYTLTDTLPYAARLTHLSIIIEDENDNAPQFVVPLLDNILFGYPDALLAEQIMPPQLLRVYAIDRDVGLNALVRYSLVENAHFQIDGVTGSVTPLRSALTLAAGDAEPLELVVRATDRDGAADGLQSERSVLVRRLLAEHITVISVQEQGLEDAERVVDRVYTATGLELKILHSARISVHGDASSTARQQDHSNVLRMFAYAVNADSTGFMQSTEVQNALHGFDANLSAMTFAQHQAAIGPTSANTDQVALVVLCAVLGVLLLLTGIGTFVMWWYKIRPYEYRQMEDGDSVASGREPVIGRMEPSAVVVQPEFGLINRGFANNSPKGVLTLNGSTTQETGDDASQLSRAFAQRLDRQLSDGLRKKPTAPSPPPSVGVRFNEMVERIDIEIEPDADNKRA